MEYTELYSTQLPVSKISEMILKTNRTLQHLINSKEVQMTVVNFAKEVGIEQNHKSENATWVDNLYRENVEKAGPEPDVNSLERYDEECLFLDSRRLIRKRWSFKSQLYWVGILRPFREVSLKWPFVKHKIKTTCSNIVKALPVLSTFCILVHSIFRTAITTILQITEAQRD